MKLPKWLQLKDAHETVFLDRQTGEEVARGTVATPGIPYPEEECNHQWVEKIRGYAPPRRDISNVERLSPEVVQAVLLGITTIVEECALCHEMRREVLHGSLDPQLDDILDNVILYGTQFLQRDGNTFVFQRYVPLQQQTPGLPLR